MARRNRSYQLQGLAGNAKMIKEQVVAILMLRQGGKERASRLFVILFDNILVSFGMPLDYSSR